MLGIATGKREALVAVRASPAVVAMTCSIRLCAIAVMAVLPAYRLITKLPCPPLSAVALERFRTVSVHAAGQGGAVLALVAVVTDRTQALVWCMAYSIRLLTLRATYWLLAPGVYIRPAGQARDPVLRADVAALALQCVVRACYRQ